MTGIGRRLAELSPEARLRLLRRIRGEPDATAASRPTIASVPRDRRDYPLSFNQERLWFLDQLTPGNSSYNLGSGQTLGFAVDTIVLDRTLNELAKRHEALRTSFHLVGGEPVQRVAETTELRCEFLRLEGLSDAEREHEAQLRAAAFAARTFDLTSGPLCRALVVGLSPCRSLFVFVIHHIIADGWSLALLMRELGRIYGALARGTTLDLVSPAPTLQYLDYAIWQRHRAEAGDFERGLAYWRTQLEALPTPEMPTDRPRPRVQRYAGDQLSLRLQEPVVRAAREIAKQRGTTLFVVLLSAFAALLARYTGEDDLPIGIPVANRQYTELERVVGFFANTLVIRADLGGDPTFSDLLARVHSTVVAALEHQDTPFSTVVSALSPAPDLSRNPLFQVSLQLVTGLPGAAGAEDGQPAMPPIDRATSIYDLSMNLWEVGPTVEGLVEFDTDLFDRATVERMASHFQVLLEASLKSPGDPVHRLPMMSEDERRRVLVEWNAMYAPVPDTPLIHRLIEAQVARTPNACAVRQGSQSLSYSALDTAANQLAHGLAVHGVGRGDRVGVSLRSTPQLLVAILGVLKSGAAFVPLDPAAPVPRTCAMLEDCGARVVLSDEPGTCIGRTTLSVEQTREAAAAEGAVSDPGQGPDDLAYILFTSGSTGRPKGVMVPHRAVVNYLTWCQEAYPAAEGVGAPLCSSISSDMAITTLFLPLLAGRTVILLGPGHPVEQLDHLLAGSEQMAFVKLTPSHLEGLRLLSAEKLRPDATAALIVGGEALRGEMLAPWRDQAPDLLVVNEYGPTEATIGCAAHLFRAGDCGSGPVPIGRPIANTRLYVLDPWGGTLPAGVPGELYIGGAGLALGYVGRPDLTAERFVRNPFQDEPGDRLYRTGDRVRRRADGILEYLGRLDDQLKIRGHRVEPGEVEAVLRAHNGVRDAAVAVRETGADVRLVAYVMLESGTASRGDWQEALAAYAAERLPPYMMPTEFVGIEALPLTPSGKTDRRALVTLDAAGGRVAPLEAVAPCTGLEELLARVFADVLGTGHVTVRKHFFADLGGHSLLAIRVIARLRELLGVDLPLGRLFERPTVEGLARSLNADAEAPEELEIVARAVIEVLDTDAEEIAARLGDGEGPEDVHAGDA